MDHSVIKINREFLIVLFMYQWYTKCSGTIGPVSMSRDFWRWCTRKWFHLQTLLMYYTVYDLDGRNRPDREQEDHCLSLGICVNLCQDPREWKTLTDNTDRQWQIRQTSSLIQIYKQIREENRRIMVSNNLSICVNNQGRQADNGHWSRYRVKIRDENESWNKKIRQLARSASIE